jgi:hypothetical protein
VSNFFRLRKFAFPGRDDALSGLPEKENKGSEETGAGEKRREEEF